ncbi:MAG: hypothetical protein ACTH2Q_12775 [Propionibacteriaceae bacterium]
MPTSKTSRSQQDPIDRDEAAQALAGLDADRSAVAARAATPGWLLPLISLVVAGFVAAPALPGGGARGGGFAFAAVALVVLVWLYQRQAGVKSSRLGLAGWQLYLAAVVVALLMFSVSLGLVSFGLNVWVVLPALVAGAATWLFGRGVEMSVRSEIRDGR